VRAHRPALTTVLLAVLVTVLLTASIAGIAVLLRRGTATPRSTDASAGARDQAAAWVTREIGRNARIACEPVMCDALLAHGAPSGRLRATAPEGDLPAADIMVLTAALRGYRSRLDPLRLAAFGRAYARVEVYALAGRLGSTGDPATRRERGEKLLFSARTRIAAPARAPLNGGRVAARLLSALNHATATYRLGIGAFGPPAPGADPRLPIRSADVTTVDGTRVSPGSAATRTLLGVLRHGPDAANLDLSFRTDGSGRTVLHVLTRVPVTGAPAGVS